MSKILGILAGFGTTFFGYIWFYWIMYNWLWLGLVNSQTHGWIIGFGLLFILFIGLTIPIIALIIAGYVASLMIWSD